MKICSYNIAKGLGSKIGATQNIIHEQKISMFVINEADINASEIPEIPNFKIFR